MYSPAIYLLMLTFSAVSYGDEPTLDLLTSSLVRFRLTTPLHMTVIDSLENEFGPLINVAGIKAAHAEVFVDARVHSNVTKHLADNGILVISIKPYSSFPVEVIADSLTYNNDSKSREKRSTSVPELDMTVYHTYSQMMDWLSNDVQPICGKQRLCKLFNVGNSIDGNPITGIQIGKPCRRGGKQKMFIDCGIHAREWVAPSVCLYFIGKLLNEYDSDSRVKSMVNNYDWYILPMANPDGYIYSMASPSNRLWRKNRRDNAGSSCFGVDLNRNWGFEWGGTGASPNKCSDVYRGASAFSEPESDNVRKFVRGKTGWHSYLTYHSYGELILYVWGYTTSRAPNYLDMAAAGNAYNTGLTAVNGKSYFVGQSGRDLSVAAGGSDDWFYSPRSDGGAGCPYSYTMEMRDGGSFAFILPTNQILPTVEENFAGLRAYITHLEDAGKLAATCRKYKLG